MPPLANREQYEAEIVADLEPIFAAEYQLAIASPTDIPFAGFERSLRTAMAAQLSRVFMAAGAVMFNSLGIAFTSGSFSENADRWAETAADELTSGVVDTSRDMASSAAEQAGGDVQALKQGMALVFLSDARLKNIAITEVTRAVSAGEHAVVIPFNAGAFGRHVPGSRRREEAEERRHMQEEDQEQREKDEEAEARRGGRRSSTIQIGRNAEGRELIPIWRIDPRSNVCEFCLPLNGHSREVWGTVYPGGPPGHPRCILPGNHIHLPGELIAATKSLYVGRCVEATLADGRRMAVTCNHPILTNKGWLAAKLLHEGLDVFCGSFPDRISRSVVPNNQHMPTLVEEVFRSFVKSSGVVSTRMPSAAEDFHGDAQFFNGEIDVVNKLGFLRSCDNSSVSQDFRKNDLLFRFHPAANLSSTCLENQFFNGSFAPPASRMRAVKHLRSIRFRRMLPAILNRLRHSSGLDTCFQQPLPKCSPRNANFFCQSLFSLSGDVSQHKLSEVRHNQSQSSLNSERSRIPNSAQRYAHLKEAISDNVMIDSDLASKFQNRFAGLISPQKIIDVRNFEWSGHVYDFQCEPYQLYFCNDVIVHNCRCHLDWIEAAEFARRAA